MKVRLLDVNVLVSLLDSAHVHHASVVQWFRSVAAEGWATCPITQNGFIRVVSHLSYPNLRLTPALAAGSLSQLIAGFSASHHFWPNHISLTDTKIFDLSVLTGSRQTTDAYLSGLAYERGGRVATLERGIPWRAVRGATEELVEKITA